NQLALGRSVHAVEARRNGRRTRNAHVHFLRSRVAHHAHDLPAGRAAYDGVVNQHHPFTFKQRTHRVQFQTHPEVAHALLGLDEGSAHVVVANQCEAEWDSALGRVSECSRHTRIGHRHHDVSFHACFTRQLSAQTFAAYLHRPPKNQAVRTRKVHMFEDAARLRSSWRIEARSDALWPDDDQFARFYVTLVSCTNQIKCAGFRG